MSGFLFYNTLSGIYKIIEKATTTAQFVAHGNFSFKLPEHREGAVGRLYNAFGEMTEGVNAGFEKLKNERLFLKNLISDISHQMKTPLAALKMYNEIVLQEPISETARDFIEKSGDQLERLEWLILGLLKMARIEAGCMDLNMQDIPVSIIVEDTVNSFKLTAKKRNIELSIKTNDKTILRCDPDWLKEALCNIVKNCIEYVEDGGKVMVETDETSVMVLIRVTDNGAGIHPDDLPNVFKRFYRGRSSRGNGSGIGLSLAKSITEQMGGTLSAGGSYGQGAAFTFTFLKDVM